MSKLLIPSQYQRIFTQQKYMLLFFFGVTCFSFLGFFAFDLDSSRSPASMDPAEIQDVGQRPMMGKFSKHLAVVQTHIFASEEIPESNSDSVELVAEIKLNREISQSQLAYAWLLDDGVTLLNGDAEGILDNMKVGETRQVRIQVSGLSKEHSRVVRLSASLKHNAVQLGSSALIHSRPEDSFEYVAPQLQLLSEEVERKQSRGIASESEGFKNSNKLQKSTREKKRIIFR